MSVHRILQCKVNFLLMNFVKIMMIHSSHVLRVLKYVKDKMMNKLLNFVIRASKLNILIKTNNAIFLNLLTLNNQIIA